MQGPVRPIGLEREYTFGVEFCNLYFGGMVEHGMLVRVMMTSFRGSVLPPRLSHVFFGIRREVIKYHHCSGVGSS